MPRCLVATAGRPCHSLQATWQPRHAMQRDVSIKNALGMCVSLFNRRPGPKRGPAPGPGLQEDLRDFAGLADVHKAGFVFGDHDVWVAHRRQQPVGCVSCAGCCPTEAERHAHEVHCLALHLEGRYTNGNHRDGLDLAPRALDHHGIAVLDPFDPASCGLIST